MKGDPVSDGLALKSIMYNEKMKKGEVKKGNKIDGKGIDKENDIADVVSDNMGLACILFLHIFRMD